MLCDVIPMTSIPEKTMTDDKQLKQAVLDELEWEPSVNAAHIGVTAKDGVVTFRVTSKIFSKKARPRRLRGASAT